MTLISKAGRNNTGTITVRHRGGQKKYSCISADHVRLSTMHLGLLVSFTRLTFFRPLIGLIKLSSGAFTYIILPHGVCPGWRPASLNFSFFKRLRPFLGDISPMLGFRGGDSIFGLISATGERFKWARASGTSSRVLYLSDSRDFFVIVSPAGFKFRISLNCRAILGRNSNILACWSRRGSAGFTRHLGIRPTVRGVAMNPVDHPHGGRTKTNQPEVSPWGWVAKHNL